MTISRFFVFVGVVFLVALVIYVATTPRHPAIELTGVVTGNEVIVSPKITGRIERLLVDEGSQVKEGQLIAELDSAELRAQRDSAQANIHSLEAKVREVQNTWDMTNAQTSAGVNRAAASLNSAKAQLEEAQAQLMRDELDAKRAVGLFESGVASAQERDRAVTALKASQARVKSLEDQVKAQEAELAAAQANRQQLNVQQSDLAATRAQLAQARAAKEEAETRLAYTKIHAPLSGIVSVRVARQGEVVQPGSPIVTIIDIDHLWVRAGVEETYADMIQYGEKLKVRLPSGDLLDGTVFFKGVESDFATQRDVSRTKRDIKTFAIKISVPNEGRRLFAGMTATVLLPAPPKKKPWYARWRASV